MLSFSIVGFVEYCRNDHIFNTNNTNPKKILVDLPIKLTDLKQAF